MMTGADGREPQRISPREGAQGPLGATDEARITSVLELFERVQPRTRASYRGTLRSWWRWCASQNKEPWPAEAADVAEYVAGLIEQRCSTATLRRINALLGRAHRLAGLPDPFAAEIVRTAIGASYQPRVQLSAKDDENIATVLANFSNLAPSSLANYRSDLRHWWSWCIQHGRQPWPAQVRDVAEYASAVLDGGGSPVTLQRQLRAALAQAHRLAGQPDPTVAIAVRAVLDPPDPESDRRFTGWLRREVTLTPAHDEGIAAICASGGAGASSVIGSRGRHNLPMLPRTSPRCSMQEVHARTCPADFASCSGGRTGLLVSWIRFARPKWKPCLRATRRLP